VTLEVDSPEFKISDTTLPVTECHIPEDLNLHLCHCENLKCGFGSSAVELNSFAPSNKNVTSFERLYLQQCH